MPMEEPEFFIIQPGLGGVAWLGEVIDGEPSPIGPLYEILSRPQKPHTPLTYLKALQDEAENGFHKEHRAWVDPGSGVARVLEGLHIHLTESIPAMNRKEALS